MDNERTQSTEPQPSISSAKPDEPPQPRKKKKPKKKSRYGWLYWGISILFLSFALTVIFSFITEIAIQGSPAYICVIVLVVLLVINIGCDILANAIVSCLPEAFHAMASNKIKGAKRAVFFCKNQTKLSSIFADVIGDICGIVSGAAGTALVVHFSIEGSITELVYSIVVSALIGALTVGGKALCKHFALKFNKQITFGFAKFTTLFKKEK